jgi:hypothetical protein
MLLQLLQKTASAPLKQFKFPRLIDGLTKDGYAGVLQGLREGAAKSFGVTVEQASPPPGRTAGELFFPAENKVLYLKVRWGGEQPDSDPFADPGKSRAVPIVSFEAGLIAPIGAVDPQELTSFCEAASAIVEVECNVESLPWNPLGAAGGSLAEVGGKAVAPPAAPELELCAILRERKLEPFLAALQEKKGELILDQWLAGRDDVEEIEYFIDKLFEVDFFDEEIVVYSRQTNQPVLRAKDRAGLEALKNAGVRDVNGDELDVENVKRLLMLPKDKRPYLAKGWAARVGLIDLLFKLGLDKDQVREFDPVAGWSILAALYDGRPFMFVFGKNNIEPKDFAALAPTIRKLGSPTVVAAAKRELDADAAKAAGAAACLGLAGAEEFNTVLLDYLAKQRRESIAHAMADFDGLLRFAVVEMSLARFTGDE